MKKKVKITLAILIAITGIYFYTHSTPEKAIRTSIFSIGRFELAFSCKVEYKDHKNDGEIFEISPPIYEKATGTTFEYYIVSKNILGSYSAEYYFNN